MTVESLRAQFLPAFIETARKRLERIRATLSENVPETGVLIHELHALAGESAVLGLPGLYERAHAAELSCRGELHRAALIAAVERLSADVAELKTPAPSAASPHSTPHPPARRRLLLVDDSETNRLTLSALLEDEGFEIEQADSVAEARRRLMASEARYDILLLDLHLGDGLGTELVPLFRERLPGAPIVMISGSVGESDAIGDGVDAVVPKGADFREVLGLIQRVLE